MPERRTLIVLAYLIILILIVVYIFIAILSIIIHDLATGVVFVVLGAFSAFGLGWFTGQMTERA